MFAFLQGFAIGLFLSCMPWFLIGMVRPELAVPVEPPRRWQVVARYWFAVPCLAFLLLLTSLWGGFGPSLAGWLAGLAAVAVELPLERRLRRWWSARAERRRQAALEAQAAARRAELERQEREAGVAVLDPARPPVGADEVVLAMCEAKRRLLAVRRPELASGADRLYTRYSRVREALGEKFDPAEITFERANGLVEEVSRAGVDSLNAMAARLAGIAHVDVEFVRRRLQRGGARLPPAEREALSRRLELVEECERGVRELGGEVEAALTALDDAAVAVARVQTDRPQAAVAAEQALRELRRFTDKAALYGRSAG